MWSFSYVTCVDIIAQVSLTWWSMFLFLDVPTMKLTIIIIVLPTDQPELKVKLPSPDKNKWIKNINKT